MAIDIYHTHNLNRTLAYLDRPASHLLDTYFPQVQEETTEEIHFDLDNGKPRITPYVSPLKEGKVIDDQGYSTKTFKPAYVKDKRVLRPNQPLKRQSGEQIGGNLTPMQRREMQLTKSMADQLQMLTRREEVQASEALRTGQITVEGEGYPTVVVDFQRDAALTITLSGATAWGAAGVKPVDMLEDWAALIQEKSGAVSTRVTMDPKAWKLFKADADVKATLDYRRGTTSTINVDPIAFGQGRQKARYKGSLGEFDFWVYQDRYVDEDGVTRLMLPDNTVILGGPDIEGTRAYGVIEDEKAGYRAIRYYVKSWLEDDPAIRYLLLQGAPLMVPYRVNASLCATVA